MTEQGQMGHKSAVDLVVDRLRDGIQSGRFALGQRLVEADITAEYNVSRTSVRSALTRLAAEGLLDLIPNRGAKIKKLSRQEVGYRYQIREYLEALAAKLAAENIKSKKHKITDKTLLDLCSPKETYSVEQFRIDNRKFHNEIFKISGNPIFSSVISNITLPMTMVELQNLLYQDRSFITKASDQHAAIAKAILDGDAAAAEKLMFHHVKEVKTAILALPDDAFGEETSTLP